MLQASDGKTEVAWVPRSQLTEALTIFEPFIVEGLKQAPEINVDELLQDLVAGGTKLGIFYGVKPFVPLGAWFSDLRVDEKGTFATIFALGGRNPNQWGHAVAKLLEKFARENGCYAYRGFGRLGWIKYARDVKLVETVNAREGLFEKVLSQ